MQTSKIRKEFYKRLFYIGLCIIPIIIFAKNKDSFRFAVLLFFLIGMYQLIRIFIISQLIVDDFSPPKTLDEKAIKPFDKFIYHFSSILFFVGLVSQIFAIPKLDNTINGTKLFWIAGLIGVAIATILTIILKIKFPSVYYESKRRYTVHLGLFIGFFLTTSALIGSINHSFADKTKFCKNYIINKKGKSGSSSTRYFIHLTVNNEDERFSIGETRYNKFEKGEEIEICAMKGKFGFDYVTEFNKMSE